MRRRKVRVFELDGAANAALAREGHPLGDQDRTIVVAADAEVRPALLRAIRELAEVANGPGADDDDVDVADPGVDDGAVDRIRAAQRQLLAQSRILRDGGGMTAAELAAKRGSRAGNRSQLAYRWKREGRIFSVTFNATAYYLAFQFDAEGRPVEGLGPVLAALTSTGFEEWDIAVWFLTRNRWLGGRRPADVISAKPDAVLAAARHAREPVTHRSHS